METNIRSKSLCFFEHADIDSMWPRRDDVPRIADFLPDAVKRPDHEVDYVQRHYGHDEFAEPPCVLGFLQVFALSNGDVLRAAIH